MFRVISFCVALLVYCSCTGNTQPSDANEGLYDKVLNYWEGIDTGSLSEDSLEQHIVDYLYLVGHLERARRDSVWPGFYKCVEGHPNRIVVEYLGETDSPLYSPELLEEYLMNIQKFTDDEATVIRAAYLLDNIGKNPVGSVIADLRVSGADEATTLHRLIRDAGRYCLIIFYDPECSACDAAFELLDTQGSGGLKVIAISVTGRRKVVDESWESVHVADEVEMDERFYYTSLPSIYIVDKKGIIREKNIRL